MVNKVKEEVQNNAFQAWLDNDKIGLCELSTGTGKTFVFFRAVLSIPKGSNVLLLAETVVREKTILEDAEKFEQFYGVHPLKDYNFRFACYQAAYKYSIWDYFPNANEQNTLIGLDETHDIISHERFRFVLNSKLQENKIPRIGLSATIDRKTLYEIQGQEITKFDLLQTFCPIVYSYTLQESIDSKSVRPIKFFVLKNKLDDYKRNITSGQQGQRFQQTEKAKYEWLDNEFKRKLFLPAKTVEQKKTKDWQIMMSASARAKFLYSLPSKLELCKELISKLKGRTLIFGQDSKSLLELCPNAIVSDNKNLVQDLADFKSGKTNICASNKILKQGENIPNLDNVILFAYYSKVKDFVQMIGRILRENKNTGNIIILCTTGSQEEKWLEMMTAEINEPFIYCSTVDQLIKQL